MPRKTPTALITTVIPTYRRAKLLRRAIQSVLHQTYPHLQVCVYDNRSEDETPQVVQEFMKKDARVKYFRHPQFVSARANYRFGLDHLTTPFFSILCDDDLLLPEFYETAMGGFEKLPEAGLSGGLCLNAALMNQLYFSRSPLWADQERRFQPPQGLLEMLKKGPPMSTAILFKTEAVKQVGLSDGPDGFPADMDLIYRIGLKFPMIFSEKPCALCMFHKTNVFWGESPSSRFSGVLRMVEGLKKEFSRLKLGPKNLKILQNHLRQWARLYALEAFQNRNSAETQKMIEAIENQLEEKKDASLLKKALAASLQSPRRHSSLFKSLRSQFFKDLHQQFQKDDEEEHKKLLKYLWM